MLKLETPNLHEIGLDRVIAYGHTWSPMHELVPDVPLRHGHAISIDMAYSATLANLRGTISVTDYKRILGLFSRAGLSMDHHQFDEDVLDKGTKAILKTRDGKLRAAIPAPLGKCIFLNDVSEDELFTALRKHKEVMKSYPRNGEGIEAFVDASDTGYTTNKKPVEEVNGSAHTNGNTTNGTSHVNGTAKTNGAAHTNGAFETKGHVINSDPAKVPEKGSHITAASYGMTRGLVGDIDNAQKHASGPEGVDGLHNGGVNGLPQ